MNTFEPLISITDFVIKWEPILNSLGHDVIYKRKNKQHRSIKQIVGHMIDSASNNIHRIVHLQYQPSPMNFPDYAHFGNNDRWIAIQNFQDEEWSTLVQHWKFSLFHIAHVIRNIDQSKLENIWISALDEQITLRAMVLGFQNHIELHLNEIEDLINSDNIL